MDICYLLDASSLGLRKHLLASPRSIEYIGCFRGYPECQEAELSSAVAPLPRRAAWETAMRQPTAGADRKMSMLTRGSLSISDDIPSVAQVDNRPRGAREHSTHAVHNTVDFTVLFRRFRARSSRLLHRSREFFPRERNFMSIVSLSNDLLSIKSDRRLKICFILSEGLQSCLR